jgi:hypothetical protein
LHQVIISLPGVVIHIFKVVVVVVVAVVLVVVVVVVVDVVVVVVLDDIVREWFMCWYVIMSGNKSATPCASTSSGHTCVSP